MSFSGLFSRLAARRAQFSRRLFSVSKLLRQQAPDPSSSGKAIGFKGGAIAISIMAGCVLVIPVYKLYCAHYGGQIFVPGVSDVPVKQKLPPIKERRELVTINFSCDAHSSMPVQFVPCQSKMEVLVGEPALAFFACYNTTNETLHGMATYTIFPMSAHYYFTKLQCFCFEEQRIKPHEYIELPVFFYIEPDFSDDPNTASAHQMILNYTFFNVDAKV